MTHSDRDQGFMALIAVMLLATGTLAFSLASFASAASYAESATLKEYRIQAGMDLEACLDSVSLMAAKDYFLHGTVELQVFGCVANVTNDFSGNVSIDATSTVGEVEEGGNRHIPI